MIRLKRRVANWIFISRFGESVCPIYANMILFNEESNTPNRTWIVTRLLQTGILSSRMRNATCQSNRYWKTGIDLHILGAEL